MKDLIKLQDEEFDEMLNKFESVLFSDEIRKIKKIIAKVRKETIEYEREQILKALPEKDNPHLGSENQDEYVIYANGYNDCIKQVKQILKELL